MEARFEVIFLEAAEEFIGNLEIPERRKLIYNLDKSRFVNDPKLFKKLTEHIWEFRTKYNG